MGLKEKSHKILNGLACIMQRLEMTWPVGNIHKNGNITVIIEACMHGFTSLPVAENVQAANIYMYRQIYFVSK